MEQQTVLESLIVEAVLGTTMDPEQAIRMNDYDGRGMFNPVTGTHDKCFGVVGSAAQLADFFVELTRQDPEAAKELVSDAAYDDMGLDLIVYFPRYQLELDC